MEQKEKKVTADSPPAVERFLRYKLIIQARSKKTVSEYRSDLHRFFCFLVANKAGRNQTEEDFEEVSLAEVDDDFIKNVTTLDILEFLMYTANVRNNAASARARKLSAIKAFYKYIVSTEHLMEKNPAIDIETPKKRQALPKYLTENESLMLLDSVSEDQDSKFRERNFCIITLFLNCGMRLSELVGINLSDIDREFRTLRVIGKGAKERMVYLNDACREALTAYLPVRAQGVKLKDKNALFISRLGKRISNQTVQWVVYKYLDAAGLGYKNYSTHKLRHTAATLMYQEGGVDMLALKEILGHSQLNTTQIYTHLSNKQLEEAVSRNPLAKVRPIAKETEEDDHQELQKEEKNGKKRKSK